VFAFPSLSFYVPARSASFDLSGFRSLSECWSFRLGADPHCLTFCPRLRSSLLSARLFFRFFPINAQECRLSSYYGF